ncbi:MAG TPA: sigma-70 family RNA polymerase sigma factor [Kofleriaceae bacterium]|nr:sigma-70 family RNA polymerase sigma factor [Kofleriaceae bacterium]
MGHVAMTDAELVEASRRGERDAFGQLVSRYQDVVCAVSYSGTGNWALSEDVAQDTFIAAWRQLGQLRETGRLRAWLCGIARNLARKARQRTSREVDAREADLESELPATGVDPFSATAQAEVDRVVREALARIPDRYRETLVLYYCENQSVREVATMLGIAEDAAMQRLSRGRRYLADGVNELVERSLRTTRGRKDLRMAVLAALPHVEPPSPPLAAKGSTMWKLVLASAALTAGIGTTAVLAVTHADSDSNKPVAAVTVPTPPLVATSGSAAVHAPSAPAILPLDKRDMEVGSNGIRMYDHPDVISKADRDRLNIEKGPSRGPANAPVTIVVYQDLMCKYCGMVLGTIDQLWDEYPGKLRLVVKQFPVHTAARLAAEACFAADAQGKFWELHDVMFANQEDLSRDAIVGYAKQAGLDATKIADALDHHTYADALASEVAAGKEIGVRATPEFLINGKDFTGFRPVEDFRAAIDAALAEVAASP